MAVNLQAVPALTRTNDKYTNSEECTLEIRCEDRLLNSASVLDQSGKKVFSLESKSWGRSWSLRHSLKDTSGQHILDVRHHKSKMTQWIIEDPNGNMLCLVKDGVSAQGFTTAHAQIDTHRSQSVVNIQSFDLAGSTTIFQIDEVPFAEMLLTENNDGSFLRARDLVRTGWKLRVAARTDLSLVLALAFARAEICHLWRR